MIVPRTRGARFAAALLLLVGVVGLGNQASASALPRPLAFAESLDLECFRTDRYVPAQPVTLLLRHLNPVLAKLPPEKVTLGERQQLCVPVTKNGVVPPGDVLPYLKYVDLSCYQVASDNRISEDLRLSHLNPVLQKLGAPRHVVTMVELQQLCVPVAKDEFFPPKEILHVVQHLDLACYLVKTEEALNVELRLGQLNPRLAHLPDAPAKVTFSRQLCVPVQKEGDEIPGDVREIVQWIDLEKYEIVAPKLPALQRLTLTHLNPVLSRLPRERATFNLPEHLAVPVAKNDLIPPG
ncbi:hypothetical protein ACFWY5_37305 [Nonomuraea sp. NPDC059007]|uniref:hypothetical protein n=1 Tax=Nonomuraea sp. NPDC059007 TaxID=3346692 RepID=UPI00368154AC